MTPTVLLFKGSAAFDGLNVMVDCLAAGFEYLGLRPRIADLRGTDTVPEVVRALADPDLALIVCMNSFGRPMEKRPDGTMVVAADGGPFRSVRVPVIDYYVDHPIYHFANIRVWLPNQIITVPTGPNVELVRTLIRDDAPVHHLPHGGNLPEEGAVRPWAERDMGLFASMSLHHDPETMRAVWSEAHRPEIAGKLNAMVEEHDHDPEAPLQAAIMRVIGPSSIETILPWFTQVDSYLRARVKLHTIRAIARRGLPLTLCGPGWPDLGGGVRRLASVPASESLRLMGRARITLNLLPPYYHSHERPLQAALHGGAAASSPSPWLDQVFGGSGITLPPDPDQAADILADALDDPRLAERARAGHDAVRGGHSWLHRAANILALAFDRPAA